jgi:nucleoporin SEH1
MQIDSEDYLQDVVFNYYGNKMAVCSSDRKIKIYEKSLKDDKWEPIASWEVRNFIILGT